MKHLTRLVCSVLISSLSLLLAPALHAANLPDWKATVPSASFSAVTRSSLSLVRSSSPSCTLVVIDYFSFQATPPNDNLGAQFLLINGKGQILATGEVPSVSFVAKVTVLPLLITPRKVTMLLNGVLTEATIGPNKQLVFKALPFQQNAESLATTNGVSNFDGKSIFTSLNLGQFVTEIRRYSVLKLKP